MVLKLTSVSPMAELVEELMEQLEGRPAPRLQREAALQRRRSSRVTRPRLPPGAPLLSTVKLPSQRSTPCTGCRTAFDLCTITVGQ